jgi:hypothetical protein
METQLIIDAVLFAISSIIGWFARELWSAVKDLKVDLAKLREDLPKTYVLRDDYKQDIRDIKDMIVKIYDKLDNKADK